LVWIRDHLSEKAEIGLQVLKRKKDVRLHRYLNTILTIIPFLPFYHFYHFYRAIR